MSDTPVLIAETRTEFGKGASRRARRAAKIPAVLYGHGADPVHIDVPGHDLFLIVRGTKNALVELRVDGKSQLALVKEVQVHPVSRNLLHADFLAVKAGEKVDVEVPVVVDGESAPGTAHTIEEFTILVKASATAIPEDLKVSIEGLEAGSAVRVADLVLPAGVEVELDPEQIIVSIQETAAAEEEEAPAEAEASEAEPSWQGRGPAGPAPLVVENPPPRLGVRLFVVADPRPRLPMPGPPPLAESAVTAFLYP